MSRRRSGPSTLLLTPTLFLLFGRAALERLQAEGAETAVRGAF